MEHVFLNDGETFTNLDGCTIIDRNGIAYDLSDMWARIPIRIRESCRLGYARNHTRIEKVIAEGSLPSPY
jgi:hypothetical protein